MALTPESIRDRQRELWNEFSAGWGRHDAFTMDFLAPAGRSIIASLRLKETDRVIDIATGTGEPGLAIAGIVKKGTVTGTDLSEKMLAIAIRKAETAGLKNFSVCVADASSLPFPDQSFDAVSCRMGFMFFPDMTAAAREMVRVLKPGGRLATSVWGEAKRNAWITTLMNAIGKYVESSPPEPNVPGLFRCAQPGLIAGLLRDAGLSGITETSFDDKVNYGSIDYYWQIMNEVAAPVVHALARSDEATRQKIRQSVYEALGPLEKNNDLSLAMNMIVVDGHR